MLAAPVCPETAHFSLSPRALPCRETLQGAHGIQYDISIFPTLLTSVCKSSQHGPRFRIGRDNHLRANRIEPFIRPLLSPGEKASSKSHPLTFPLCAPLPWASPDQSPVRPRSLCAIALPRNGTPPPSAQISILEGPTRAADCTRHSKGNTFTSAMLGQHFLCRPRASESTIHNHATVDMGIAAAFLFPSSTTIVPHADCFRSLGTPRGK